MASKKKIMGLTIAGAIIGAIGSWISGKVMDDKIDRAITNRIGTKDHIAWEQGTFKPYDSDEVVNVAYPLSYKKEDADKLRIEHIRLDD